MDSREKKNGQKPSRKDDTLPERSIVGKKIEK